MPPIASPLNRSRRQAALEQMTTQELDILVIGGGVVGAGAALDAVTRGLSVGLLEANDFASGTSSRSSKLIHGGLRYLKQVDFRLVFEALRERRLILQTLAPHLARPVPFIYPLQRVWDRAYVGLGIGVYDLLGAGRGAPSHAQHLSRRATRAGFRNADPTIRGGVLFYEGQLDDARHTMMLARTAASHGALVATSTRATGFLRDGRQVVGVMATDRETGNRVQIRARQVVNATGVWTEDVQDMLGARDGLRVRASKGVHVLVPRSRIDSDTGLITETDKSLLFVIPCPWSRDLWVIGTTDTPWDLDRVHPTASSADIDYILAQVNTLLATPLAREDVVGVFAGLRPLIAGGSDDTTKLSREHAVVSPVPGLTVVAGGKYTTYRIMAADVIDEAVRGLQRTVPASCTARLPLVGADGYWAMANRTATLATEHGLTEVVVEHLLGRYGTAVGELFDLMAERSDLARPLAGAPEYLRAEAYYAVSHEGALHLDDILVRRLRVSVDTPSRGTEVAEEVASLVADPLGWDDDAVAREVEIYRSRVRAELAAQDQPDDLRANAARLEARDPRCRPPVAAG